MTLDGIKLFLSVTHKYIPDFSYEDYKIVLPEDVDRLPESVKPYFITASALNNNLMECGYCLSLELFNALVGSNLVWDNFIDVCNTLNLFHNRLDDIDIGQAKFQFSEWLKNYNTFIKLEIGDESEYITYFRTLIGSNSVITKSQYNSIKEYVKIEMKEFTEFCTDYSLMRLSIVKSLPFYFSIHIPDKRVLHEVIFTCIDVFKESGIDIRWYNYILDFLFKYYLHSYNDVLFVYKYISGSENNFKSISRSMRKILLSVLNDICAECLKNTEANNLGDTMQEILPYKKDWIVLGEKLHPGDYKVFTLANTFFSIIRNDIKAIKKEVTL